MTSLELSFFTIAFMAVLAGFAAHRLIPWWVARHAFHFHLPDDLTRRIYLNRIGGGQHITPPAAPQHDASASIKASQSSQSQTNTEDTGDIAHTEHQSEHSPPQALEPADTDVLSEPARTDPTPAPSATIQFDAHEKPEQIVLYVLSKADVVTGAHLHQALIRLQLTCQGGAYLNKHRPTFAILNATQPMEFPEVVADMEHLYTPGIMLVMNLPVEGHNALQIFEDALLTLSHIAKAIDGDVFNAEAEPFTTGEANSLRAKLRYFYPA